MATKVSNILETFGFPRVTARVLEYLIKRPDEVLTARQIERGADLRQPEVSIAMSNLKNRKWVTVKEIPSSDIGRPEKSYKLVPLETVYADIEKEQNVEVAVIQDYLAKLKQAMIVPKPRD